MSESAIPGSTVTALATEGRPEADSFWPYLRFYIGLLTYSVLIIFLSFFSTVVFPTGLLRWESFTITSDSMRPAIRAGDVVVAKPVDPHTLAPGMVIVFEDPAGRGVLTHRLVAIEEDGTFRTRGDANWNPDSTPVPPESVIGKAAIIVPFLGLPEVWAENGDIGKLLAVAVATVAVVWCTRWGVLPKYRPWRKSRLGAGADIAAEPSPLQPEPEASQLLPVTQAAPPPSASW